MTQGSADFVLHEDQASPKLPRNRLEGGICSSKQISIAESWNIEEQHVPNFLTQLHKASEQIPTVCQLFQRLQYQFFRQVDGMMYMDVCRGMSKNVKDFPEPTICENHFWTAL